MSRRREPLVAFNFRMPAATYEMIKRVAAAQGVDNSAVMNQILMWADQRLHELALWYAAHSGAGGLVRKRLGDVMGDENADAVMELVYFIRAGSDARPGRLEAQAMQARDKRKNKNGFSLTVSELIEQ